MKTILLSALLLSLAPSGVFGLPAAADPSCYTLSVKGMHCASCHGIVSKALPEGKLAVSKRTDAEGTMKVCGGKMTSEEAIKKINDLGYTAEKI